MLFNSSDKAVNPTNVMGTSSLMGKRLMIAANCNKGLGATLFVSHLFGSVVGSHGSVIAISKNQVAGGGPVALTDKGISSDEISRF